MRYVLQAFAEPGAWEALTDEERAAWVADDAAFNVELADRGIVVFGIGLAEADTATTVRMQGRRGRAHRRPVRRDRPSTWAACLVIDVADLDEALDVARRCPAARIGPLEVRPERG